MDLTLENLCDLGCLFVMTIKSLAAVNHKRTDGRLVITRKREKKKDGGGRKRDHTLAHIGPSALGATDSSVSYRASTKRLTHATQS